MDPYLAILIALVAVAGALAVGGLAWLTIEAYRDLPPSKKRNDRD